MKNLMALEFIVVFSIVSQPISQSRVINPRNDNLIVKTCKQTPNYDLCVSSLISDPKSSTADIKGLALIMVDITKAKAVTTLNHIKQLLTNSTGKETQALKSCVEYYNTILKADVPVATDALQKGDRKFAEEYSNDASIEVNSCEEDFTGSIPLTDMNKVMHDVAAIAAAIVRVLMHS